MRSRLPATNVTSLRLAARLLQAGRLSPWGLSFLNILLSQATRGQYIYWTAK